MHMSIMLNNCTKIELACANFNHLSKRKSVSNSKERLEKDKFRLFLL